MRAKGGRAVGTAEEGDGAAAAALNFPQPDQKEAP